MFDLVYLHHTLWLCIGFLELNYQSLSNFIKSYSLISTKVIACPASIMLWYFMHHIRARSLKVVESYTILEASYCTCLVAHINLHINRCFSGSLNPFPSNTSILYSSPIPLLGILLFRIHDWTKTTTTLFPIFQITKPLPWQFTPLVPLLFWLSLPLNCDEILVLTFDLRDTWGRGFDANSNLRDVMWTLFSTEIIFFLCFTWTFLNLVSYMVFTSLRFSTILLFSCRSPLLTTKLKSLSTAQ